jgi:hypothetical protein
MEAWLPARPLKSGAQSLWKRLAGFNGSPIETCAWKRGRCSLCSEQRDTEDTEDTSASSLMVVLFTMLWLR